jgi:hypothetical protein
MNLTLVLPLLAVACLAGCGDADRPKAATSATPTTTPSIAAATETPDEPQAVADAEVDAMTELAITRGAVFLANFCVHKLGAAIGQQQPPTAEMRELKNNAVFSLIYTAKHNPNAIIAGKLIQERLNDAERLLTRGDCDVRSARKIRDAASAL